MLFRLIEMIFIWKSQWNK